MGTGQIVSISDETTSDIQSDYGEWCPSSVDDIGLS
jgi:hypothetical protein